LGDRIKKHKRAGRVACKGEKRNVYSVLVGKPAGETKLGMSRRVGENNIKNCLKELT
jgi:hypothetical protein